MPKYSKKDYIEHANYLNEIGARYDSVVCWHSIRKFERDNPRFDRARFQAAVCFGKAGQITEYKEHLEEEALGLIL